MIHARLDNGVSVGDAPTSSDDVELLAKEGVQSILCLRAPSTESEYSSQELGVAASRAGMIYLNFPVAAGNLDEFHINAIRTKLKMMPKPVFLHAENWHRAAAAALIDRIADEDWDTEQTWSFAAERGIELEEPQLRAAVERHTSSA